MRFYLFLLGTEQETVKWPALWGIHGPVPASRPNGGSEKWEGRGDEAYSKTNLIIIILIYIRYNYILR